MGLQPKEHPAQLCSMNQGYLLIPLLLDESTMTGLSINATTPNITLQELYLIKN